MLQQHAGPNVHKSPIGVQTPPQINGNGLLAPGVGAGAGFVGGGGGGGGLGVGAGTGFIGGFAVGGASVGDEGGSIVGVTGAFVGETGSIVGVTGVSVGEGGSIVGVMGSSVGSGAGILMLSCNSRPQKLSSSGRSKSKASRISEKRSAMVLPKNTICIRRDAVKMCLVMDNMIRFVVQYCTDRAVHQKVSSCMDGGSFSIRCND